jgi:hypothetical protein
VKVRSVLAAGALAVSCAFALPAATSAQDLREQCQAVVGCVELADAATTLPARLAIAAAGGNPVAGTASTLGMRVPGSPRWSVAVRSSLARAHMPAIAGTDRTPTLWSIGTDVSVGIFNGFYLVPTIGGFGSVDVLGSVGLVRVPEDDGFDTSSPLTWSLGARVGIFRESFTAPGVSVSAMYRSLPDVEFSDGAGADFELGAQSVVTYRATVGKRILGMGLTGGVAHDRGSSDVTVVHVGPLPLQPVSSADQRDVSFNRTSFFGNVSYTLLILNMAAELGWQESGDRPEGAHGNTGKGGLFGGIAVRLAI